MKRLGECACDIVAKATPANFGGLRLRKSTTPVRSSSAAPNMLGDGRRPAYITGHTDGRLVCHGEDCDAEACVLFAQPARSSVSAFRVCRLIGAGRFADGGHLGWRGRTRANCSGHHRRHQVIGVFWGQDYHDAENVRSSKNGRQLDFTIDGAKATFVRDPAHGVSLSTRPTVG